MKASADLCAVCQRKEALVPVKTAHVCGDCLTEAQETRFGQWKSIFLKRQGQYLSHCRECLETDDPEAVHQARVNGRKVASLLQFLDVPKKHKAMRAVKSIHALLNPIREADVFIETFSSRKGSVHQGLVKKITKKRTELEKKLHQELPALIKEAEQQLDSFVQNELVSYTAMVNPVSRIQFFEQQFNEKTVLYHEAVAAHGKKAPESVEALHKVRIRAKALRYMYADASSRTGDDFSDKEAHYKAIQSQFGEINDVQDWIKKLTKNKKKLDAPKKEIKAVRTRWQNRLNAMIEQVDLPQAKSRA